MTVVPSSSRSPRVVLGTLLLAGFWAPSASTDEPLLEIDIPTESEVTVSDPVVDADVLSRLYTNAVARGRAFRVRTPVEGECYIDARSYFFDTYLVLRDEGGKVLAEDDDGLIATHSRITGEVLAPDTTYLLQVCALHGGHGPFQVRLSRGKPPALGREERDRLTIEELEEAVRRLELARGADHPDTGTRLDHLATALHELGRYVDALPHLERALSIAIAERGEAHPETATRRNNLARILQSLARYDEAEALYQTALERHEAGGASDPMATATVLNNLASILEERGSYEVAAELHGRALSLRRAQLGSDNPLVAVSLNNLGTSARRAGDYEAARAGYEEALEIVVARLGDDHAATVPFQQNLAELAVAEGRFDEAEDLLQRVAQIASRAYGETSPRFVPILVSRASLLHARGRYDEAVELYSKAIAAREVSLGPSHPETARVLSGLAGLLDELGRFEESRPLHARALAIREEQLGADHPDTLRGLHNFAWHLASQGLLEEARPLLERNVELRVSRFGANHPETARSRTRLAYVLTECGRPVDARREYSAALAAVEDTLGPDHPDAATIRYNLALVDWQEGDLEGAEAHFRHILEIRRSTLGPTHARTAVTRVALADLLADRGRADDALPLARQAAADLEAAFGEVHPETAAARHRLARVLADLGRLPEAIATADRALDAANSHGRRVFGALTESERLRYAGETRAILELFFGLHRAAGLPDSAAVTHRRVLEWKGRVSRSLFADGLRRSRALTPEDRDRFADLRRVQSHLSDELYRTSVAPTEGRARRIDALHTRRNELERALVQPGRVDRTGGDGSEAVQLPADTIALDFFVHSSYTPAAEAGSAGRRLAPQISVWILDQDGETPTIEWIDLGGAETLRGSVTAYLQQLVSHRGESVESAGPEGTSAIAVRLREALWDPIAESVEGTQRILVSPDGFLGTLPLETVQLEDGTYLIEKHAFVYLQDLSDIPETSDEPRPASLLLAGAVDYREGDEADAVIDDKRGGYRTVWRPLSATREEVDAVADVHEQAFGETTRLVLTRGAATEERIREELPRYRYVHLATHGYFQPEGLPSAWSSMQGDERKGHAELIDNVERVTGLLPGLLSGLVFAGANTASESGRANGLLTAEELTYTDLSACNLVVLSACQTGLGEPRSGEGLLGLRRSVRQAGASTVISSLWSVLDEATRDLMIAFYENLWVEKMTKLDALREAQLMLLRRNRAEYGEALPASWGAFVLDGAWGR